MTLPRIAGMRGQFAHVGDEVVAKTTGVRREVIDRVEDRDDETVWALSNIETGLITAVSWTTMWRNYEIIKVAA